MNILNFILLVFSHYLIGWGILRLIGVSKISSSLQFTFVSLLFGIGFSSLLPVVLEMMSVAINPASLLTIILIVSVVPAGFWFRSSPISSILELIRHFRQSIRVYELVFFGVFFYLFYIGMLKCAYFPPVPRDLTSGAEAIAEYTIKEQHINNSYFTVDLSSTDNYQKPPFLLGLQIIYKTFVQPFGQVWLIIMSFSFFSLFYILVRRMIHPVFAGIVTLLLFCTPEFYGYAITMPLYDFPNTVYLFVGCYYLYRYFIDKDRTNLWLSSVGFGLATLVRPETLFLVAMLCGFYYIWSAVKGREIISRKALMACFVLMLTPLLIDIFTMEIFIKHFIPSGLNFGNKFNNNLLNFEPLNKRWEVLTRVLMFSGEKTPKALNRIFYAETFNIMTVFIIIEFAFVLFTRKIDFKASVWFIFMVLVFVLLLLIGYLLPFTEFTNAKRGLFKLLPLIYVFVVNTRLMQFVSGKLTDWELR